MKVRENGRTVGYIDDRLIGTKEGWIVGESMKAGWLGPMKVGPSVLEFVQQN